MSVEKIDELYKLRNEDPQAALSFLGQLGSSPEEKVATAVVLVDCGDAMNDVTSVSQGVEIFDELMKIAKPDSALSYNLANGLQVRSRLGHGPLSLVAGQAFEDRFQARVHFGSVMRDSSASYELRSQALTNIGILLLETSRWVEALDCFQKALILLPRNGIAAYQEMRHSMRLAGLFCRKSETYQTYCHVDTLLERIRQLSDVVSANYDTVVEFSGKEVLPTVKKAVEDAAKIKPGRKKRIQNPYFAFIEENGLALSIHCSAKEYSSGRFDLLTVPSIHAKISDEQRVPEIFAMINVMKSDFAFARQVYFDVREYDTDTPFFETTSHADTLDYAVYGVRFSALTSAQRIAFDILDKIAVALACYLGMKKAHKTSFSDIWGKTGKGGIFTLNEEIANSFRSGNPGLIALYNIYHDISKDDSRGHGFMEAHKSYRNSSTHRFSVLHDDMFPDDHSSSSLAVDHTHLNRFESLTLDSLKLVRAALFYFVDMINFAEEISRADSRGIVVSSTVPDHDYIRGR
ncbi:LA2681 family HEPN domain-containing protein [uncultured Roseobacter sp.]|uniref:LA2681 family HEPN domain-containing protein n=1 Tax=uncultured Roseobacter sp. TaxID=114847 RepID=UPI0026184058|nr:LA2681 family HEPN domain-containing protein [uncultured Roseobacter sp.]